MSVDPKPYRHRFPKSIIQYAVWLYHRFTPSYRDTVKTTYTYGPYGQTCHTGAANSNSNAYTGREMDAGNLYYYHSRYYNTEFNRFISQDSTVLEGGITEYAYALENPIIFVDPSGNITICDVSNFAVGFGDALTFGLTDKIRDVVGGNEVVNKGSGAYVGGGFTGVGFGVAIPFVPKGVNLLSKTQQVTYWAPEGADATLKAGQWVMTGPRNGLAGGINRVIGGITPPRIIGSLGYHAANFTTTVVPKAFLAFPKGWESVKGLLGQRMYKP